ncbi:MAG: ribbon-helix-helix protein, CopG family [Sporichthyaceae bacterium]
MIRKQLYIDDDLNAGLRVLAGQTGRSEAEHVRAALREYLDRRNPAPGDQDDPLLALIGLVADEAGATDVAVNHDVYLYGSARG